MSAFVLLFICFFARRDDSIVGQIVNLRPIGNRPAGSAYRSQGSPAPFAACRYAGQPILAAAGFQPARAVCEDSFMARKAA
jgi:hypothetical protein